MITLYGLPGTDSLTSLSPFVEKLAVWLRMAKLEFRYRNGNPRKAPRGKMPYVVDDAGHTVGDSQRIIEHLTAECGVTLDEGMSDDDKARAHLLRRTVEDGTYFQVLALRWVDDEGWRTLQPLIREMVPAVARGFVPGLIRGSVRKQAVAQGAGRRERSELVEMTRADLAAFAQMLGEQPYFLGERPRSLDATMYGFLAVMTYGPPMAVTRLVDEFPKLADYTRRMREAFGAPAR